jgi:hypothetical protein
VQHRTVRPVRCTTDKSLSMIRYFHDPAFGSG